MTQTAENVFRDFVTDGVPASGAHHPCKAEIREWGASLEANIAGFQAGGGIVFQTKAAMTLGYAVNQMAWVIADSTPANNGIYQKQGGSGAGSWTRVADLPYSFIVASDVGEGSPDSIQATSSLPISSSALVLLNVFQANTGSPVTVAFNGNEPLVIKSNSGNEIAPGGLQAGMLVLGRVSGPTFRLVSDQVSAAIIAQAEAWAEEASAQAERAEAAAGSLDMPVIGPNDAFKVLTVNAESNGYEIRPVPGSVSIASRAFAVSAGYRPPVAPDFIEVFGYAVPADGGRAFYAKAAAEPSHAGKFQITLADGTTKAWYELAEREACPEMFGAKRDGAANDYTAINDAAVFCAAKSAKLRLLNGSYSIGSPLNLSAVKTTHADNTIIKPAFDFGTAITYAAPAGNILFGPKIAGYLQVDWPGSDYTKERWSFLFQNVYMGEFHIGSRYATIGVYLLGNQRGVSYNDFHLGYMDNNQLGIYGDCATSTGWVNGNRFHGGFFTGDQPVSYGLYAAISSHLYIDNVPYINNGNVFLYPSLEWIGPNFKLAIIRGLRNKLLPMYAELDITPGVAASGAWVQLVGNQNMVDCRAVPYLESSRVDVAGATGSYVLA